MLQHSPILKSLTTVVLITVVITVQVSVTSFGGQDAATGPTLEVAGRALCRHGNNNNNNKVQNVNLTEDHFFSMKLRPHEEDTRSVPSTPSSGSRQVVFPPSSGN